MSVECLERNLLSCSVLAAERVLDVTEHVFDRIHEWRVLWIEKQNHFHCERRINHMLVVMNCSIVH